MSGDVKVPKRRFKEFVGTEGWDKSNLDDLCDIYDGTHQTPNYVNQGVMFLSVEDIKTLQSQKYISQEDFEKNFSIYPEPGDVLMTRIGDIGTANVVESNISVAYYVSLALLKKKRLDSYFLKESISSKSVKEELWKRTLHIAFPKKINKNEIGQVIVSFPNSKIEQEKIGGFFKNIDNLIGHNQRKLEKLKALKKAYLTQMFPAKGESKPKLRFAGFNDEWKENEFSDITFLAGEKNKDNLPYESYSISNEKGFIPQNEQFENGGTMKEADKKMYYIVRPNSFAYNPARINVGSIGYSNLSKNVIVSSLYEVFQTVESVDDRFLWHWFKTDIFQRMIEKFQEGGVRLYFYYDKLCMGSIMLPSLEEQKRIGKYMDRVDKLIILHQRKLEKLQNLKKAYLNEMFI